MRKFDHTSRADVNDLALAVLSMEPKRFAYIAPAILAGDLMRTHWLIRLTAWIVAKRRKIGMVEAYRQMRNDMKRLKNVDIFDGLQVATAMHIRNGRDRSDKRSVGGFNAKETELMCELIVVAMETSPV